MPDLPETETATVRAIWSGWEKEQDRSHRTYLGASVLGDPCERKLWYSFRWAHDPETFVGRQLRLFDTGHSQEARMVADLRRAGMDVLDVDPRTEQQFSCTFAGGHGGGHTDGEVSGVPEAPKTDHLLECKTHNHKSFTALKRLGVQGHKPMHYDQMQVYMHLRGYTRGLYLAVNKNDDELYSERIEHDPVHAARLMVKAERIVSAETAPARLHEDPSHKMAWQCGFCPAKGLCHERRFAIRNCRTCLHSTPVMDGEGTWTCSHPAHPGTLTKEDQKVGCAHHRYLPSLVPGEQVDVDGDAIAYAMPDGVRWVDGGGA